MAFESARTRSRAAPDRRSRALGHTGSPNNGDNSPTSAAADNSLGSCRGWMDQYGTCGHLAGEMHARSQLVRRPDQGIGHQSNRRESRERPPMLLPRLGMAVVLASDASEQ